LILDLETNECKCSDSGQYVDIYLGEVICLDCHPLCDQSEGCWGPGSGDCYYCSSSSILTELTVDGETQFQCECPPNYYLDVEDCVPYECDGVINMCTDENCDDSCQTCMGPSYDQCVHCPSGTVLQVENSLYDMYYGRCECTLGYYLTAGYECEPCPTLCRECILLPENEDPHCLSCEAFSEFNENTCECKSDYYYDTDHCEPNGGWLCPIDHFFDGESCQPCHFSCHICSGPMITDCIECKTELQFEMTSYGLFPFCACAQGTYLEDDKCLPCFDTCMNCVGPHSNDCTECYSNTDMELIGSTCVCESGYLFDYIESTCVLIVEGEDNCDAPCETCGENTDICGSCLDEFQGYYSEWFGVINCVCPDGTYLDDEDMTCYDCHQSCETCSGPGSRDCLSCKEGEIIEYSLFSIECKCPEDTFRYGDLCINSFPSECMLGQYQDSNDLCQICDKSCLTCSGPSVSQCIDCDYLVAIKTSDNRCICKAGYYRDTVTSTCLPCDSKCKECSTSASTCTVCYPGSFKSGTTCIAMSGWIWDSKYAVFKQNNKCLLREYLISNVCLPCDRACYTCNGPEDDNCTSCDPYKPYALKNNSCTCQDGFFEAYYGECMQCNPRCATCIGEEEDQCLTCPYNSSPLMVSGSNSVTCQCNSGYIFNQFTQKCESETACGVGLFKSATGCQACHKSCATCVGPNPDQCLSCHNSKLSEWIDFYENKLVYECYCDQSKYESGSGECLPCHKSCQTCKGSTEFDCEECKPGSSLVTIGEVAKCECDPYFIRDPTTLICTAQPTSSECSYNEYLNVELETPDCEECDITCNTCIGGNINDCISCPTLAEFYPVTDFGVIYGFCYCPNGTYNGKGSTGKRACLPCDKGCAECDDQECYECSGYFMFDHSDPPVCKCPWALTTSGNCQPPTANSACPSDTYWDSISKSCEYCHASCATCYGPSYTHCTSCDKEKNLAWITDGISPIFDKVSIAVGKCRCALGFYSSFGDCLPCDPTCETCNGPNDEDCLTCKVIDLEPNEDGYCECPTGQTFYQNYTICAIECDENEFLDDNDTCRTCAYECSSCWGPGNDQCYECDDGFELQELDFGEFICRCPTGLYLDNNNCVACDDNCYDCLEAADDCIACADPRELQYSNGKGECVCKSGWEEVGTECEITKINDCGFVNQYVDEDETCQDCDISCGTCSGPEYYECLLCKENAYLESGSCYCDLYYYMDENGDCIQCGDLCSECNEDYCFDCPEGTFSGVGGNCEDCDSSCLTCNGDLSTDCTSCEYPKKLLDTANGKECKCPSGWTPNGDSCEAPTNGCPLGHYLSSGVCKECSSNCSSCLGPRDSDCTSCYPEDNRSLLFGSSYGKCRCNEGFFEISGVCMSCDPKCKICNGYGVDDCLDCEDGMDLIPTYGGYTCACDDTHFWSNYSNSCVLPDYTWTDSNGFELPCSSDCEKCIGPNDYECSTCRSDLHLIEDHNTDEIGGCICEDGYFRNDIGECEACDSLCAICSGPDTCDSCVNFAILTTEEETSYCECRTNYVENQNICESEFTEGCTVSGCTCHPSCFACNGPEVYNCLTCDEDMIFSPVSANTTSLVIGYCICPYGEYFNGEDCEKCGKACLDCDENGECLTCNFYTLPLSDGDEDCTCEDNYVYDIETDECIVDESLFCNGLIGYYESESNCEPCYPSCLACTGSKETDCLACIIPGQQINPNTNLCECPEGYVLIEGECVSCDENCLTCSVTTTNCKTCRNDFQAIPVSGKCVCPSGSILDTSTNTCETPSNTNCSPSCNKCVGPSPDQCTECKSGLIPMNESKIFPCGCANGKFLENNACVNCNPNCSSCVGPANKCTACNQNAELNDETMSCDCVTGYVRATENDVCTIRKGSSICPSNQYDGGVSGSPTCRNCHVSCLSCLGPNETDCLACPTDTEVIDSDNNPDNGVKCKCPDSTFFSSGKCLDCNPNCSTCTALDICTECNLGSHLSGTKCVCDYGFTADAVGKCHPPQGSSEKCLYNEFYSKSGICIDCHYSCLTCFDASEYRCNTCGENRVKSLDGKCICKDGLYEDSEGECVACNTSCTKCTGPGRNSCQSCLTSTSYLDEETDICKCYDPAQVNYTIPCTAPNTSDCPTGKFKDTDSVCKNCDASCLTCFSSATTCLKCADKYVENGSGGCECSGYIKDNVCTTCPNLCTECDITGCLDCVVGATEVNKQCVCNGGYYLLNNSCAIIPTCNTSEFFSLTLKKCSSCYLTCRTCNESSYQDCSSCKSNATLIPVSDTKSECKCDLGYYLNSSTGDCLEIPNCTAGQYLSTSYKCESCHATCSECLGPLESDCISCKQGISITLVNNTNKTGMCKCPNGKYFDLITKLCVDCNTACLSCSGAGSNNCITCNVGYAKDDFGNCSCNTKAGAYFSLTGECKLCNSACMACAGPSAQECTKCKEDRSLSLISVSAISATGSCACKSGTYYDTTSDSCKSLTNCPGENYYISLDLNKNSVCNKCNDSCRTCLTAGADNCTSCGTGYKLYSTNTVVSYTGPISGTCSCSNLSGSECLDISCPTSLGFYVNTPTTTSSKPYCAQCDKSCKTCSNGSTTGCLSCEYNYVLVPNSASDLTGTCKCDPNYQDPKDSTKCNSKIAAQTGNCPLTKEICNSASDCVWSSTSGSGSLTSPSDKCLKQVYDYCCSYNSAESGCNNINYQFKECSSIAVPIVESAKFTDDTTSIRVKFSNGIYLL